MTDEVKRYQANAWGVLEGGRFVLSSDHNAAIKARDERIKALEDEIRWVLNDAMYKAPEQLGTVAYRWLSRLKAALLPSNQAPVAGEGSAMDREGEYEQS